jgi:hypothetical protein
VPQLATAVRVCNHPYVPRGKWRWWLVVGVMLVLTALAWYLIRRGLSDSDKIASVGSLFVGIVGLVLSLVSIGQGRGPRAGAGQHADATARLPDEPADLDLSSDLERLRSVLAVDHQRLFGIDEVVDDLGASLRSSDAGWLISIFGDAGVGVTGQVAVAV